MRNYECLTDDGIWWKFDDLKLCFFFYLRRREGDWGKFLLHFVFRGKIDPKLQTRLRSFSCRHFRVDYPSACCHPLHTYIQTYIHNIYIYIYETNKYVFKRQIEDIFFLSCICRKKKLQNLLFTCTSPVLIVPICPAKSWWVMAP